MPSASRSVTKLRARRQSKPLYNMGGEERRVLRRVIEDPILTKVLKINLKLDNITVKI